MNQMKKNQQESKMKKGRKPESRKFKLDESIDFALLRNHQRATTTEQKQNCSIIKSEVACNTSQRVGCQYY